MKSKMEPQPRQLKMKIDPKDEGGVYSNVATVLSSENEFIIDFGMFLPGTEYIRIGSRVVLNPKTAKQLLLALTQNIRNFENKYGEIKLPSVPMMRREPEIVQ
ncbi:MAG: DUF3467 domain-containing protein [bacterium]